MYNKYLPFFFASSFFTLFLTYSALKADSLSNVLLLIGLLILVIFGLFNNFANFDTKSFSAIESANIVSAHLIGAWATYLLIVNNHFNSVVAASLVGLVGYFVSNILAKNKFIDLAPNFYCGTFVGMVSATLLPTFGVVAAGVLSGLLFIFLACRFNGCGGKLGSIAFMSCVIIIGVLKFL
jgi:hypothetical protein